MQAESRQSLCPGAGIGQVFCEREETPEDDGLLLRRNLWVTVTAARYAPVGEELAYIQMRCLKVEAADLGVTVASPWPVHSDL